MKKKCLILAIIFHISYLGPLLYTIQTEDMVTGLGGAYNPGPSACPDKWDRSLCPHLPPHLPQTRSPLSLHQSLRLNYLLPHHHHLPLHLHHLFHPLFPSLRDERIYISCHLKKALVINKFTLRNTYSVIQKTCLPLNLLWTSNIYSLSISVNNCENQKMNHVQ